MEKQKWIDKVNKAILSGQWSQKADDCELNLDGPYLTGIRDYKAALKAEIEKRIYRLNQMGFNSGLNKAEEAELKALKEFLSLLDTVKPV